jgi:cyclic pyranopterin phosphate synthase
VEAGFDRIKFNIVAVKGLIEPDIIPMARFCRERGFEPRFIEFMPLDAQGLWDRNQLVPGREVFERISDVWPLEPLSEPGGTAPAERFRFADGTGEIGLISSVSEPFCGTCNRLRVTADGALRNCLFSDDEQTVRDLLRNGGSDTDLSLLFRQAVWAKFPGHGINEPGFLSPARSMSMIGG